MPGMRKEHSKPEQVRRELSGVGPERKPQGEEQADESAGEGNAESGHFHFHGNELPGRERPDRQELRKGKIRGPELAFNEAFADGEGQEKRDAEDPAPNVIRELRIVRLNQETGVMMTTITKAVQTGNNQPVRRHSNQNWAAAGEPKSPRRRGRESTIRSKTILIQL